MNQNSSLVRHLSILLIAFCFAALPAYWLFPRALTKAQAQPAPHGNPAQIHGGIELSAAELSALPEPNPQTLEASQAWIRHEIEEQEEELEERKNRALPIHSAKASTSAKRKTLKTTSEMAAAPAAPPPAPTASFAANVTENLAGGYLAADTTMGVSRTHVVVSSYILLEFYDKAGKRLQRLSVYDLFSPLNLEHETALPVYQKAKAKGLPVRPLDALFDARCLYDEYRQRFWVVALMHNVNETVGFFNPYRLNKYLIAVSKTSNPLDGWILYWADAVPGDGTDYVGEATLGNKKGTGSDYPTIGVDPFGFYMSCVVQLPGDTARFSNIVFFPAQPLANGTFASGWQFGDTLRAPGGTTPYGGVVQPAVHHGTTANTYFSTVGDLDKIYFWRLSNHLTANMKLEAFTVPIKPLTPLCGNGNCADAGQLNSSTYSYAGKITNSNLGNGALKTVFRNNALYTVMNDAATLGNVPIRSDSRVVKISNVNGASPFTVGVDDKFADSNGTLHNSWASIEVNKNNDAAIVHGAMGLSIFPSVKYRVLPNGQTTVSDAQLAKAGEDTFVFLIDHDKNKSTPDVPWDGALLHDCNGAAVDPYDDTAIWLAAPYSTKLSIRSNDNFGIWVTKVYGERHPDLIVQDLKPNHRTYHPGDQLNVVATVRNQGDGATTANAFLSFHLSADPTVSVLDTKLGDANIPVLNSNQNQQGFAAYTIPANVTPGVYWVGAFVLPASGEYSTTNNNVFLSYPIYIRKEDANTFLPAPGTKWHDAFGFTGEVPMSGDFNGDGKDDICVFNKTDGSVYVALSDGAKFNGSGAAARWITGFSQGNETPLVGDFNGDGKADVATMVQNTKSVPEAYEIYVALSTGTKFGTETKWHDSFSADTSDRVSTGDVNGDGKDDIIDATTSNNGDTYVTLSDGHGFRGAFLWRQSLTADGAVKVLAGDFDGDGKADVMSFRINGVASTSLSTGTAFGALQTWSNTVAQSSELPLIGDFNGDGKDDAAAFTRGTAGDVFVSSSDGTKLLAREKWHETFAINNETPVAGDFNGDGADDIATFLLGTNGDVFVSLAQRKGLGVVSAASYAATVAPDSIASVFGLNLAQGVNVASTIPLPNTLGGTDIDVINANGAIFATPLFFVSPGQVNFLVSPIITSYGIYNIAVKDGTGFISRGTLNIQRIAPALFTLNADGQGIVSGLALRVTAAGAQSYEPIAQFNQTAGRWEPLPIDFGRGNDRIFLLLFGTGIRRVNTLTSVTCMATTARNREDVPVLFAGAQGGFVGLDQINVELPRSLAGAGETSLTLTAEGRSANVVKINVK